MKNARSLTAKFAVAAALGTSLIASAVAPSAALAQGQHYFEPDSNGSVWSYYPGYTTHITPTMPSRGSDAYARVPSRAQAHGHVDRHLRRDEPAGSRFEDSGNE